MTALPSVDDAVALQWIDRWDRQQTSYLPHRQEQFEMVADLVAAAAGPCPRVLDLGCGPGSLGRVVHDELPDALVTGVDADPLLLSLAAVHERAGWLTVVDADLRDPSWPGRVTGPFDAVVAATALHWLPAEGLERTYGAVRALLRPGGVFINSDSMPVDGAAVPGAVAAIGTDGDSDAWQQWWRDADAEPAFGPALALRAARPVDVGSAEFMPPSDWHVAALARAGFVDAHVAWRSGPEAVLSATAP